MIMMHAGPCRSAARCTVVQTGRRCRRIATPVFGDRSHISINRRYGFIRKATVADSDGRQISRANNTVSTNCSVWADCIYRSGKSEAWSKRNVLNSRIHRCKFKRKPMPENTARANVTKSAIPARAEHVFAHQKNRYGLFIHTIGLARAQAKLTLAHFTHNFNRPIFHAVCGRGIGMSANHQKDLTGRN